MTVILVIAAHPDDEALGCGGAIAKHSRDGDTVHILFLADGVGARGSKDSLEERNEAAFKAAEILGAQPPRFLDLPDNRMDSMELLAVVQPIEKVIEELKPEVVYTHHRGDLNVDHAITHKAVMTACRGLPDHPVRQILSFEVPSSTEWQTPEPSLAFVPNWFVDIAEVYELKQKALEAYAEEMRDFPHARSFKALEALATWRGASVGVPVAEAFKLERKVQ